MIIVKSQSEINHLIRALLENYIDRGEERGLQVAAYLNGERIVDCWAGVADPASGRLVDGETLFTVWSAGKGVDATLVHLLVERGLLSYETRLAELWPEFAAHGKQDITVAHVLTHMSGIPQIPADVTPDEVLDWGAMRRRMERLTPLWKPGTASGYHAMTYGWLVGEIVQRIDGRRFADFVRAEICAPLGIRDLYFGIPAEEEPRVAVLEDASDPVLPPPADVLKVTATPAWRYPPSAWANQSAVRRACVPSSGCIANARALAAHYAALAHGERLLPAARVREMSALRFEGRDCTTGNPERRALGYHLGGPDSALGERVSAFGHGGLGGTLAFADPELGLAFALTKNRLHSNVAPGTDVAYAAASVLRAALAE